MVKILWKLSIFDYFLSRRGYVKIIWCHDQRMPAVVNSVTEIESLVLNSYIIDDNFNYSPNFVVAYYFLLAEFHHLTELWHVLHEQII